MRDFFRNLFKNKRKLVARPKSNYVQRNYPKLYRFLTIVKSGTQTITWETLSFIRIKFKLRKHNQVSNLTWNEVEVYRQIPRDWKKVAPVMMVSSLPLLNYIVLPIAYMYPHRFLCHQFWTLKQMLIFNELDHKKRVELYEPILNMLASHADLRLGLDRSRDKYAIIDSINKVKKGEKISTDELISLRPIFDQPEFNLNQLSEVHINLLVKLNDCKRVFDWNAKSNLNHYAFWLRQIDSRLNQIDLRRLPITTFYNMCYERGLSAKNLPIHELIRLMEIWLAYSDRLFNTQLNKHQMTNYTLFLHSKIFLANFSPLKVKTDLHPSDV